MSDIKSDEPWDEPAEVTAEEGQVLVDGPDGVAVSLTPAAAAETGRRLRCAAKIARRQVER
ncbi:hypothetical protein [Flavisphingomonas formosensis]|uniref:hypothetical protein n=1 Tax=Flavisphingomonas formosensis TaxID=861534 RepID=UPI0012FCF0CF|nr:hypothetical protein [Sphingomonas formosensis]